MNKLSILFLCTGNSCRSQMAEGWAKHLFAQSSLAKTYQLQISSAGIEAHGVNPRTVEVMAEVGIDISGQTSDALEPGILERHDWVITLCSHADKNCPVLPGNVARQHWDLPDPAKAKRKGGILAAFRESRDRIRLAVEELIIMFERRNTAELAPQFDRADIEIIKQESPFKGFFEMQEITLRHKLFEGGWSEVFTRELFVRGLAVVALLYDPQQDQVILIEQFRIGSLEDRRSPWLLELVAGMVEPGEIPEQVVRREAMEEAGCVVKDVVKLYDYWVSPGATNEQVAIYCGRVDTQGVGGVHGLDYEHEDIRVEVVAADWAFMAIDSGIINNAATIMALQWLQLNRKRLQQEWC